MTSGKPAANRWVSLAQNLLISAASTLVFLAALEGIARIAGRRPCADLSVQGEGSDTTIRANALRQYELVPSATFTFKREAAIRHGLSPDYLDTWQSIVYRVNSLGLRGPETSTAKSADAYRILLLGDSVAFGWGIDEQDTIAYRLEQQLNDASGGTRFEVWNCGVPGYATWQELAYLAEKGPSFHPDLVVVAFLFNDVDGNNEAAQGQLGGMGLAGRSFSWLTRKSAVVCWLRDLALSFRVKNLHPCQGPNCWGETKSALDGLLSQARALGCQVALVSFPMRLQLEPNAQPGYYDRALGANPRANYQDIIAQLCAERGIDYLDLLPDFQTVQQLDASLFLDADHPNAQGNRTAAEALFRFLAGAGPIADMLRRG